ncbi:LacI family DNA-binding transcriptional regulator [Kineococcus indalonis]|uniref:LacI family DNA-binding transcriptional regulator n=1 Tax=Kineococcus indalonis TaxID=2696566 RepID=UPI001413640F|nr:LacI family DNA-binding transcriptional regulator [Kineococcus indalonis]NAZ87680.1 substrate-binding domain-containing protein [Kineococcus indalonis]
MAGSPAGAPRPTIRSVAERAGVSKSLVSLVLQGSPKVGEERRRAVLTAVEELGYRPDPAARSLAERRTRTVGVVLDDLRNPWFVDLLDGLRPVLREHGLRPVLGDTRTEPGAVRTFAELRVDGLVLVGTRTGPAELDGLARVAGTVPTVLAGGRDEVGAAVDVVADDGAAGVRLVVRHLLDLGHRHLAHLAGAGAVGRERRAAFERAAAAAGARHAVVQADMTEDGGHRAARRLLAGPDRPTAVLAANDVSALGVLAAADDLGLRVPQDVSVAGYDDTSLAALRRIRLTSVDNRSRDVGRRAGQLLLDRLADPAAPARTELLPPRLVPRRTTAAPPPGAPA